MPSRARWFLVVVTACLLTATAYTGVEVARARARQQLDSSAAFIDVTAPLQAKIATGVDASPGGAPTSTAVPTPSGTVSSAATPSSTPGPNATAAVPTSGRVIFLDATDPRHPRVSVASLDDPEASRTATALECQRVYFAGGRGLCMGGKSNFIYSDAVRVLDARLQPIAEYYEAGLPSRTRVSRDGRYAATTVFVTGDSYATGFSSRTQIIDTTSGQPVANVEGFAVLRDGTPVSEVDFNFCGVTFAANSNMFYATLGTGGATYLVQGDIAARSVRTLIENVECPSLSPDGTRIAFKRRVDSEHWRLEVMNLGTMQSAPIAGEARSVDDQVEWLDTNHVLYAIGEYTGGSYRWDTWVASLDGTEAPRIFLRNAYSPAVLRTP